VLLYAPFIFLSKVATHSGIWLWLLRGELMQQSERSPGLNAHK
jgi:hypothetical protein